MEQIKKDGLAKSIGVSNFREEDLQAIQDKWEIPPAVNQVGTEAGSGHLLWKYGLSHPPALRAATRAELNWPIGLGMPRSLARFASLRRTLTNQLEYHPYVAHEPLMKRLRSLMDKHQIKVQAYAPLATLHSAAGGPVDAAVEKVANDEFKTPAQVLLQWAAQYGGGTVVT